MNKVKYKYANKMDIWKKGIDTIINAFLDRS